MPVLPERFHVPRGHGLRLNNHKEKLQEAWIRAIAAASGAIVSTYEIDDGIDMMLTHKHEDHSSLADKEARINIQLKATTSKPTGGYASAQMTRNRFNEFSVPNPTIPKIVVVMTLPQDPVHWLWASHRSLSVYGRNYWVNLSGMHHPGEGDVVVKAPIENVLDDVSLARMMERIGKGGQP